MIDANDGISFVTKSGEENNKNNNKKEVTCYKYKKMGIM